MATGEVAQLLATLHTQHHRREHQLRINPRLIRLGQKLLDDDRGFRRPPANSQGESPAVDERSVVAPASVPEATFDHTPKPEVSATGSALASLLLGMQLSDQPTTYLDDIAGEIESITGQEVWDVAKIVLDPDRLAIVIAGQPGQTNLCDMAVAQAK